MCTFISIKSITALAHVDEFLTFKVGVGSVVDQLCVRERDSEVRLSLIAFNILKRR